MRLVTDVLILGGGPAGAAAALACKTRGLRSVLLEAQPQCRERLGESLSALCRGPLEELGLYEEFLTLGHQPTHHLRSVWACGLGQRDSLGSNYGPDHHLDRARFDEWLLSHASRRGASILRPVSRVQLTRADSGAIACRLRCGEQQLEVTARFGLDASGRGACLMRSVGATVRRADRLIALARWFSGKATRPILLVESTESGWWYSAPTPNGRHVAMFFSDASASVNRRERNQLWSTSLAAAPETREQLAGLVGGELRVTPASPQITDWAPNGLVLPVGDAAFATDPLFGSGLFFALSSAIEAARALDLKRRGSRNVVGAYRAGLQRLYARHLTKREASYAAERAFRPTSEFWARARGGPSRAESEAGISVKFGAR